MRSPKRYRPTDGQPSGASQRPSERSAGAGDNNSTVPAVVVIAVVFSMVILGVGVGWLSWDTISDPAVTPSKYLTDVYLPQRGGLVKSVLINYIRRDADIPESVEEEAIEDWINTHVQWEVRDVIWKESQLRPQGWGAPTKDAEDFGWFYNYGDYKVASVPVVARGSGSLAGYGVLLLDAQVDIFVEAEEGGDGGPRVDAGADANHVVEMALNENRSLSSFVAR